MQLFYAALASTLLITTTTVHAEQSIVSEQSAIRFTITQLNVPIEGRFKTFSGHITFDPKHVEQSHIAIDVALASIDLGNPEGEQEAAKPDWFDTTKFPLAQFKSKKITSLGNNKYEALGTLSVKGITDNIKAPFSIAEKDGKLVADGKFYLKRLNFKLGEGDWADTSTLADDVAVSFTITLAPQK